MTGESSKDLREAMPAAKREECIGDLQCPYIKSHASWEEGRMYRGSAMPIYKGWAVAEQVLRTYNFDDLIRVFGMTSFFSPRG